MSRKWHVEMVYDVELIRRGRLCEDVLLAKPADAGPSEIQRIKIRPLNLSAERGDEYVLVLARGAEL